MAISRASDSSIQGGLPKFNDIWDGRSAVGSMDSLGVVVLSSSASNITFSNIPATYTHLQIRFFARMALTDDTGSPSFQFNGDTGSNYTFHQLLGDGSSATAGGSANRPELAAAQVASNQKASGIFGAGTIDILDYASTSKYKTIKSLGGWDANGSGYVMFRSGSWMNTAAINSINIFPTAAPTTWNQYSHFALYGIK